MRRIGYLISQYPAVNHTFILREIRELRRLNWDITVVSIRLADRNYDEMSSEEIEETEKTYYVMGMGNKAITVVFWEFLRRPLRFLRVCCGAMVLAGMKPKLWPKYMIYFLEAVVAAARFRKERVTHVHTHFSSTVTLLMARLSGISFSMTIHGPAEFDDVKGFHMAEKVAAARTVVVISHYAASQVMRATAPEHWKKVEVIRLGVKPEVYTPKLTRDHREGSPYELLMVGRLAPVKAQLVLLDVLKRLKQRNLTARLTLVGEGPLRDALEERIHKYGLTESVELTGALNHDQVLSHYRKADFFVLPSFAEGVPVVLMEAMAMEVPCVATCVMGIPELIRDGREGFLVPPSDVDALVERLEHLMRDAELGIQLARAARKRVKEMYNLTRNAVKLDETFRRYGIGGVALNDCIKDSFNC